MEIGRRAGTEALGVRGSCVSDHMSRRILAVRDDCSLTTALEALLGSDHRHVAVVSSSGTFEGLLSVEDIILARKTGPGHRGRPVGELITASPIHLTPDVSMHTAASVMLSHSTDAVGVVDPDGHLLGILRWADILAMVAQRE